MYSVRMRASEENRHISGAESIVEEKEIKTTAQSLVERALSHERGKPDFINISIELIKTDVKHVPSLPITLIDADDAAAGKNIAKRILKYLGIPVFCIDSAFLLLEKGPSNGGSMRGAILMDLEGRRLEHDTQRGIRATRMDITKEAAEELACALAEKGLSSYYTHISEALVLATKVAGVEGTLGELCWSDDPSYTAGYVASKKSGYMRIPHLKHEGECTGGRVFFVENISVDKYIHEMEKCPVMVNKFAGIGEMPDDFLINL